MTGYLINCFDNQINKHIDLAAHNVDIALGYSFDNHVNHHYDWNTHHNNPNVYLYIYIMHIYLCSTIIQNPCAPPARAEAPRPGRAWPLDQLKYVFL